MYDSLPTIPKKGMMAGSLFVFSDAVDDALVGSIDEVRLYGGKVDLGRDLGVVPHAFADDSEWYILVTGNAGP